MNVPFSHSSEVYHQKNGRKVRSRWEGTFTFRSARPPAPKGVDRLKAARDDHSPGRQHTPG